jgi:hypothetical protein
LEITVGLGIETCAIVLIRTSLQLQGKPKETYPSQIAPATVEPEPGLSSRSETDNGDDAANQNTARKEMLLNTISMSKYGIRSSNDAKCRV